MKQYRSYLWILIAILAVGLAVSACNKGNDGGSTVGVTDSGFAPSAVPDAGPAAVAAPAPAADGVELLVQLLNETFNPQRCTELRDKQGNLTSYGNLSELMAKFMLTNTMATEAYSKPVIYHVPWTTCDAIDLGSTHPDWPGVQATQGAAHYNVSGADKIQAGQSGETTYTFPLERRCGSYQFDDSWGPQTSSNPLGHFVIGKVINTGIDCPDCTQYKLDLTITGEGLTRTVKVTFNHPKANKKAVVDFGDGTQAELGNGQSVDHTWAYGQFIITAKLEDAELPAPCEDSATVENEEPCRVEWIELKPEITYGEWGECGPSDGPTASDREQQCSQSRSVRTVIKEQNSCTEEIRVKSDETTQESQPCDCPDPCLFVDPPVVEVSCTPETRESEYDSVKCRATSSVPSTFKWTKTQIEADTFGGGGCKKSDEKWYFFWELDDNDWRIDVEATACDECKKKGSDSVDVRYVEPPPPICHTQNVKFCNFLGFDCQNKQDGSHTVVKWQCQNRPPGTPGHEGHFDDFPTHDDFYGSCNTQKCYNIVN